MNAKQTLIVAGMLGVALAAPWMAGRAADNARPQVYEYATIRWDGAENTHVVRPDGTVQSAGPQLRDLRAPSRTDQRAFYMNVVLNALAREGYELAGMHPDTFVVRRPVH